LASVAVERNSNGVIGAICHRHIFNNFLSYTFSNGFAKNLTLGTGVRIETGVPINNLRAHPVYQNGGEAPSEGHGALGRTPTAGYGDLHADYSHKVGERSTLHFGADLFNVANQKTQLRVDQFQDAELGVPNADFKRPVGNDNIGIPRHISGRSTPACSQNGNSENR